MKLMLYIALALLFSDANAENIKDRWRITVKSMSIKVADEKEYSKPIAVYLTKEGIIRRHNFTSKSDIQISCTINRDLSLRLIWVPEHRSKTEHHDVLSVLSIVSIDGTTYDSTYKWTKNKNVMFRILDNTNNITPIMRKGNNLSIRFFFKGDMYNAIFKLNTFGQSYDKFSKLCQF